MSDSITKIPYGYCHCGCGQKTKIAQQSNSHYGYTKGEPLQFIHGHRSKIQKPLVERFWAKVAITSDTNQCWEWKARLQPNGYGQFGKKYAHRVVWEITHGSIPQKMDVCHSCDNRSCVNPKHLFLGTRKVNMEDAVNKGRQVKGERNGMHKLNYEQVQYIRERYAQGQITMREIALEVGCAQSTISQIVNGHRWRV